MTLLAWNTEVQFLGLLPFLFGYTVQCTVVQFIALLPFLVGYYCTVVQFKWLLTLRIGCTEV